MTLFKGSQSATSETDSSVNFAPGVLSNSRLFACFTFDINFLLRFQEGSNSGPARGLVKFYFYWSWRWLSG